MRIICVRRVGTAMLRVSLLLVLLTCTERGLAVDGSELADWSADWSANWSADRSSKQRADRRVSNTSTRKQLPAPAPNDTAHLGNFNSESVNEVWLVGHVVPGGVAVLECHTALTPVSPGRPVRRAALSPGRPVCWFHGDKLIHIGEPTPESRYVSAGTTLLVHGVTQADAGSWACSVRPGHRSPPTRLRVTLGEQVDGPRLTVTRTQVQATLGASVCLPCAASGEPIPRYRWYRERGGRPVELAVREDVWLWASGAAMCLRARSDLAGDWLCEARDALGVVSRRSRLLVDPTLAPLRERRALPGTDLRLGDAAPELHYTFIEQALRAGGAVSLRCAAGGSPPPRLTWLLDGAPLDHFRTQHRYLVSTEVSARGEVVSTLNISAVTAPDGGRYSCRASNHRGDAEHSARLNIYGPPSIRAIGPVRVVAGANATIHCPYAGYPISSISWWRRGGGAALGATGRVASRDSALRLTPAHTADGGHYACSVSAPDGAQARRDIEIQVRNPPKISPFMFSSELTEGSSAQVLCGVSSGDRPMYFSWTKDGAPLPSALQIEEKSLNEFSLLMFSDLTARHSGDYTCCVSNHAAAVNFTATLSVKVAPAWVSEPVDAAVLLGAPIMLECAAKGYPIPTVTWYKKIGEGLGPDNEQWDQVGGTWHGAAPTRAEGGPVGSGGDEPGVRVQDGALAARAATRAHQGVYRCSADNGVGPPLIKNVNLSVHEPANFESSAGNVSCVRGRAASLVCHARGDAPLAVHWTHRGARLDLNSYRWTVSEVRTGEGLRSTLQLRAAERGDAGEYRCHAHNQYGRSEILMFLHVEEPPEAPRALRLRGVGSRWVRVSWRATRGGGAGEHFAALCTALHSLPGAEPPHAAYNLTLEPQVDDSSDAEGSQSLSARLESLRPAAAYSLRLVAGNHVGRSPHSEPLMFTTLEEAPSAPPMNVRVRPAGPGELHASWSAPAQDSWNGELLGYSLAWRPLGGVGDGEGRVAAPGWSGEEMTLGGLRGGARYAVLVRAYNRAGAGPAAPAVYGAAGPLTTPPGPTPRCEVEGSRALRVRWAPPDTPPPQGYDVYYAPLQLIEPWSGSAEPHSVPAAAPGELLLQGLAPAVNYSVWLRARAPPGPPGAQPGPPGAPAHCVTAPEAPGAVTSLRALGAGVDALLVSWLEPTHASPDTHYTLHVRPTGAPGAERVLRVEGGSLHGELRRELRGLRPSLHDVWVEATSRAGRGPPSRAVGAAPGAPGAPRAASFGRTVWSVRGSRVRLACAAVGAEPLRRRWSPAPTPHAVSPAGELTLTASAAAAGNHTCSVRNGLGSDAVTYRLRVVSPPQAPAPRLHRAEPHALRVTWDPPDDGGAPILGYTVRWMRAEVAGGAGEVTRAGPEGAVLRRLACGATYHVTLQAHNALGDSPLSRTLMARTEGEKPRAAPGEEFVWANSTALRLNLLAWRARCAVPAFRLALRRVTSPSLPWTPLHAADDSAEVGDLQPGAWYEIRTVAISPAGETVALYRAATRTLAGERIGEAVEIPAEARPGRADAASPATAAGWRAGAAPALLAAGLGALLAVIVGLALARWRRRRAAECAGRECTAPHAQLYTAEPGKRNGKALAPPEGDLNEISPYATFSMSGGGEGAGACAGSGCPAPPPAPRPGAAGGGGGGGGGGCALHLRTFGRAETLDLAAPPPRPNLLSHPEYGRGRDSDSESSGSPCAACKHELYRLPAHRPPPGAGADTVPCGLESSTDETYGAGPRTERTPRHAARDRRRRRDPPPAPSVRYFSVARQQGSQEPL